MIQPGQHFFDFPFVVGHNSPANKSGAAFSGRVPSRHTGFSFRGALGGRPHNRQALPARRLRRCRAYSLAQSVLQNREPRKVRRASSSWAHRLQKTIMALAPPERDFQAPQLPLPDRRFCRAGRAGVKSGENHAESGPLLGHGRCVKFAAHRHRSP